MEVQMRKNIENLCREFKVTVLGIPFYFVLTREQMLHMKLPLWFRMLGWYWQFRCKHSWKKVGIPRMEGYFLGDLPSTFTQNIECVKCQKKKTYKYRSGIDTSF